MNYKTLVNTPGTFGIEATGLDDGDIPTWLVTAWVPGAVLLESRGRPRLPPNEARRFARKILAMADKADPPVKRAKKKGKK